MNYTIPDSRVLHHLPEFAQILVHWVSDAIQPSHPLLSPSPPVFNLSQHQGLFQWVNSSHQLAKVLTSVLPMNIQGWFPLELTGLITLQSKELSRVFSNTTLKVSILWCSALFMVQLTHPYKTTEKTIALTIQIFVSKEMPLLFNMPSKFIITFLPRSKHLNFTTALTVHSDLGAQENKISHCSHFLPCYLPWCDGTGCHDLSVLNVEFQTTFSLSFFIFIRRIFCSSLLSIFFLS